MAEKLYKRKPGPPGMRIWKYIRNIKKWKKTADSLFDDNRTACALLERLAEKDGIRTVQKACAQIGNWCDRKGFVNWMPKHIHEHYHNWNAHPEQYFAYNKDEMDRIIYDPEYRNKWIEEHGEAYKEEESLLDNEKFYNERYYEEPEMFKDKK